MKPHKHAELIKAWADGAEIQLKYNTAGWVDWNIACSPEWAEDQEYRIKTEPMADIIQYYFMEADYSEQVFEDSKCSKLKLTFDGETGELKSAEVLK